MPLVLFVLITLTFVLIRQAPGGPFDSERVASAEVLANLNAKYGQDRPALEQFSRYLGFGFVRDDASTSWEPLRWRPHAGGGLVSGDLGPSFKFKDRSVNDILGAGIGKTAILGSVATVLALAIGLTAGVIGAVKRNSVFDYGSMSVATFGMSVPNFVTGPVLILLFALTWKLLPVSGWDVTISWTPLVVVAGLYAAWRIAEWARFGFGKTSLGREAGAFWLFTLVFATTAAVTLLVKSPALILPSVTLALPFASRIARLMRAGMLEVIGQDYVRTARAKGLSEPTVIVRHALKGGILPVVSYLGPAVAGILTGSLVVERVFAVPGIGSEFVEAALSRDYLLVLGVVVLDGVLLVSFNLIVDVVYGFLDPRIRFD
jgi:oligopeptide transport system permease protein